jgi:hypothetical protein
LSSVSLLVSTAWCVLRYGCETWSLKLREENISRVLQNRVLERIFGSKTDEVRRGWRQLNDEELPYWDDNIKEDGLGM